MTTQSESARGGIDTKILIALVGIILTMAITLGSAVVSNARQQATNSADIRANTRLIDEHSESTNKRLDQIYDEVRGVRSDVMDLARKSGD
ncbi:MAG: hypothetical protein AAF432_00325 [Planctomycetota bacterium]